MTNNHQQLNFFHEETQKDSKNTFMLIDENGDVTTLESIKEFERIFGRPADIPRDSEALCSLISLNKIIKDDGESVVDLRKFIEETEESLSAPPNWDVGHAFNVDLVSELHRMQMTDGAKALDKQIIEFLGLSFDTAHPVTPEEKIKQSEEFKLSQFAEILKTLKQLNEGFTTPEEIVPVEVAEQFQYSFKPIPYQPTFADKECEAELRLMRLRAFQPSLFTHPGIVPVSLLSMDRIDNDIYMPVESDTDKGIDFDVKPDTKEEIPDSLKHYKYDFDIAEACRNSNTPSVPKIIGTTPFPEYTPNSDGKLSQSDEMKNEIDKNDREQEKRKFEDYSTAPFMTMDERTTYASKKDTSSSDSSSSSDTSSSYSSDSGSSYSGE